MEAGQRFQLYELSEDPDRWERLIQHEQQQARTDAAAQHLLESIYCEANRACAFARFRSGPEFKTIARILELLDVPAQSSVCEIGAGPGYLSWALAQLGYARLSILEPNDRYVTGTGYLASRTDASSIKCFNDQQAWYSDPECYDTIITHNCIHHFQSIPYVAACIRTKIKPDGLWLAFREWYAETASETYEKLLSHPYALKYGVYEFPYSSAHYVQAFEAAGFRLEAIVPAGYRANVLAEYVPRLTRTTAWDRVIELMLSSRRGWLASAYKVENVLNSLTGGHLKWFTRPQLMVFRRAELPEADRLISER